MTKLVTYMKTDRKNPFTLLLSDEDIDREVDKFFRKVSEQAEKDNKDEKIEKKVDDLIEIEEQLKKCREEGLIPSENSTKEVNDA